MLVQPFPTLSAPDGLAIARRAAVFLPAALPVATQGQDGTEGGSFCSLGVHAPITSPSVPFAIPRAGYASAWASIPWGMNP